MSNTTPNNGIKTSTDFFDRSVNKAPWLALGLILLIELIVFKDFFFDKVYFFNDIGADTLNGAYPILYHTADYISKYGIPKWSFQMGMGQNIFPFFLGDPFNIFFYIAGKDHILQGMVYKELAKILLGGIIFFYYLKTIKLSNYTSLVGSLLFAFCGFMIVGSGWYMFSFEALNMALLLLAFELLFTRQKSYLFPIPIFLIGISMPFNLYIYGLFLALYAIVRYLQTNAFNVKKLSLLFLKLAGLGLIGLLISAPFLFENMAQLFESPRGNGNSSYIHLLSSAPFYTVTDEQQLGTAIMRFFSNDILGNGSAFKGWSNFLEAPLFYCGLPCLLLLPQVFQFLEKKVKLIFALFLSMWLLPLAFPYFRKAFWLFTGDYYRGYSLLVALVFLFYSLQALEFIIQRKKINLVVLIVTIVILLALINFPFFDDGVVNTSVSFFVMPMLIVYGLLLFFIARVKNAVYFKWVFLAAVVFELSYLTNITINDRKALPSSELTQKTGYNDYTTDAVNYLKQIDKSVYRIDKSYASTTAMYYSFNDAMVQNYYGTTSYNSFNQQYYVYYLELMGVIDKNNEIATRSSLGTSGNIILEQVNNVKYILVKGGISPFAHTYFDSVSTIGDVIIYRSRFALPLGYTYSHFASEATFDSLSYTQKDYVSLKACMIKDKDISRPKGLYEVYLKDTIAVSAFSMDLWTKEINELKTDTLTISRFEPNFIQGTINLNENKMVYLSIPYDEGWHLKVDGQPNNKVILNAGMTGIMLEKGNHIIEMKYELRYFYKGLLVCLLGLVFYGALWFYPKWQPKALA